MRIPPFLKPGDLVLVIAPSFTASEKEVNDGIEYIRSKGFKVEIGPSVFETWGKFAGTDAQRQNDLQWAINHPTAKAVFCTRGGYGLSRLRPLVSLSGLLDYPKWWVGFSDVTLLHAQIQAMGLASMHGPMVVHQTRVGQGEAVEREWSILTGALSQFSYPLLPENGFLGEVEGQFRGGNLTLLSHMAGTISSKEFEDSILFLEEVGEYHYRIDRMLEQMLQAGLFEQVKAVVLGQFTDCDSNYFPLSVPEMVREKTGDLIPVFSGLLTGHGVPTFPMVLGAVSEIISNGTGAEIIQNLSSDPIS